MPLTSQVQQWKNQGPERLSNLLKATQLLYSGAGIWTPTPEFKVYALKNKCKETITCLGWQDLGGQWSVRRRHFNGASFFSVPSWAYLSFHSLVPTQKQTDKWKPWQQAAAWAMYIMKEGHLWGRRLWGQQGFPNPRDLWRPASLKFRDFFFFHRESKLFVTGCRQLENVFSCGLGFALR